VRTIQKPDKYVRFLNVYSYSKTKPKLSGTWMSGFRIPTVQMFAVVLVKTLRLLFKV
jgi:hypothetical protein